MRIVWSLLLLIASSGAMAGQVTSFDSADYFSRDAVLLDFEEFSDGLPARDLFSKWGIAFGGQNGAVTFNIPTYPLYLLLPGQGILSNGIPKDRETELPLVIHSDRPLRRIGFILVPHDGGFNFPQAIAAKTTITAFDEYERALGSVVREGTRMFLGLEASGTEGISRVTIKSDRGVEGIYDLRLDYFSRPEFTTYLPQLACGGGLRTSITFLNLSDSTAQGTIRTYSSAGQDVDLGDLTKTTTFSLAPRSSKTVTTGGGDGEVKTGYGTVVSNCPLRVQTVYTTKELDGTVREAGIAGTTISCRSVGAVVKDVESEVDTAIALVNPNDTVYTWIYLLTEEGFPEEAGCPEHSRMVEIPARGQIAAFISDLFPELKGQDFRGTVGISGPPMAVIIVRTLRGVATSSFPSGDY